MTPDDDMGHKMAGHLGALRAHVAMVEPALLARAAARLSAEAVKRARAARPPVYNSSLFVCPFVFVCLSVRAACGRRAQRSGAGLSLLTARCLSCSLCSRRIRASRNQSRLRYARSHGTRGDAAVRCAGVARRHACARARRHPPNRPAVAAASEALVGLASSASLTVRAAAVSALGNLAIDGASGRVCATAAAGECAAQTALALPSCAREAFPP